MQRNRFKLKIKFALPGVLIVFSFVFSASSFAQLTRIKDLVSIQGIRENELVGFGVVVGLRGTGDSPAFVATNQAILNILEDFGMEPGRNSFVGNSVAGVMITAKLPAFAKVGEKFDISISTVGDAVSLDYGVLLPTSLRAADKRVYALASGKVTTSNLTAGRASYGRVISGGTVERNIDQSLPNSGKLVLNLKEADFTNSDRISRAINKEFLGFFAKPLDGNSVEVMMPHEYIAKPIKFISKIEALKVEVDRPARVIVNQATGTIVFGNSVTIAPVSISHNELVLVVGNNDDADRRKVQRLVSVKEPSVDNLIETLNLIGTTPKDLVAILQALKSAGAIQADLKFF